ncbi:MAG: hypothetical protein ACRERD_08060, partial [Candidatus Binatia bacterium]
MNTHTFSQRTSPCKSDIADYARILQTIERLRHMTVERGCTTPEAETAALKIGQAVQRYKLHLYAPVAARPGSYSVAIDNALVIAKTDRAMLVVIARRELWIPVSQICIGSEVKKKNDYGTLIVTRWFAERAGLC